MSDTNLSLFEYVNSSDMLYTEESQDNIVPNISPIDIINDKNNYSSHELIVNHIDNFFFFNEKNINNFSQQQLNDYDLIENISCQSTNNSTENSLIINKKRKIHDKFAKDNIKRKILNHYFKFLTTLINTIMRFIFKKEKNKQKLNFLAIRYDFRNNKFNKKILNSLRREKTIKDIFLNYPNNKNKNSKKINEDVMNYITNKNNNVINNILGKLCFEFINIYYNNERKINLSKYGFKATIRIQKIKVFQDLLKTNISNNEKKNEIYRKNMEKCIQEHYLGKAPYFSIK